MADPELEQRVTNLEQRATNLETAIQQIVSSLAALKVGDIPAIESAITTLNQEVQALAQRIH